MDPALSIAVPGLLAAGTALDGLAGGREGALTWLAFWMIATGAAFGAWRAAWALLDWAFFDEVGNAGAIGLSGLATAIVVGLYAVDLLLRLDSPAHSANAPAMTVEVGAAALLAMNGWLGGRSVGSVSHAESVGERTWPGAGRAAR